MHLIGCDFHTRFQQIAMMCAGSVHMRLGQVSFPVARYSIGVIMSRVR